MKGLNKLFVMFLVLIIGVTTYVAAVNLDVTDLEINNHRLTESTDHSNNYQYERGENLDIDVCVKALTDVRDAQIEADIVGYRYSNQDTQNPVSDSTDTFDLDQNDTRCYTLNLKIPDRIDADYYKLRVRVADRDTISFEHTYELHIKGTSRSSAVQIKDVSFNPQQVVAGRAFTAMVQVRNFGDRDLSDLKATISIPELNLEASEYMDSLDADRTKTFEDLLLRIPDCTKPGTYDVNVKVEFDEFEETQAVSRITVLSGDTCAGSQTGGQSGGQTSGQDKTIVNIPPSQEVAQGAGVVFPILITNAQGASKTYTLSVSGASSWASTRIDPSSVVVVPQGQSKTLYLYVSTNENAELGDKVLTVSVDSGTESKQTPVTVKITKGAASSDWAGAKNWLEIGLIVLVIILIIIGLIIGFNKLKENRDEPEPYY